MGRSLGPLGAVEVLDQATEQAVELHELLGLEADRPGDLARHPGDVRTQSLRTGGRAHDDPPLVVRVAVALHPAGGLEALEQGGQGARCPGEAAGPGRRPTTGRRSTARA